jgi:hypothetical protein
VSLWKHTRRRWDAFTSFASVEVGDGPHTSLWHYVWCEDQPLKEPFVELFCLARNRDALVANLNIVTNDVVHWDMSFIMLVHDWENWTQPLLSSVWYYARVGRGGDYELCWTPSKRKSFEIKSFYKVLLPNVDSSFPRKSILKTKAL